MEEVIFIFILGISMKWKKIANSEFELFLGILLVGVLSNRIMAIL